MTETVIIVSDKAQDRLWKTLDIMSDKLVVIERRLSEVVRLEERVNFHDESLCRYGASFEKLYDITRRLEMWQAHHGDSVYDDAMLDIMKDSIKTQGKKIMHIEKKDSENRGQKDVVKEVLKWFSAILAAVVIYYITRKPR